MPRPARRAPLEVQRLEDRAVPAAGFQISLNITGMSSTQAGIFRQAARRWQQVIIGDLPDVTVRGVRVDDVLIEARARRIDGVGHILGQAGPDAFRAGSMLPSHGVMS